MDSRKNSTIIVGTKLSTLPTPLNTPSISSECSHSLMPAEVSAPSTTPVSQSMPRVSRSESHLPTNENDRKNTASITHRKIGIAHILWVRILSSFMDFSWLTFCPFLSTTLAHSASI